LALTFFLRRKVFKMLLAQLENCYWHFIIRFFIAVVNE